MYCNNLDTTTLKLFHNHGGIYRFRKKFKNDPGEINPLGVHRNMRVCILERTRVVVDNIFVYHFVDPSLRVEIIFRKEKTAENG